MPTASRLIAPSFQPSPKTAQKKDLFRITYLNLGFAGYQALPKGARSWLAYFVALVKLGYFRIEAPLGALADAHTKAGGNNRSTRSAFRALAELEKLGYISRRAPRLGSNYAQSVININLERFQFFLSEACNKKCVNITHMPNCQPSYTPNTSCDPVASFTNSALRSTLKAKPETENRKPKTRTADNRRNWINPIIYTLGVVLRADNAPDRDQVIDMARRIVADSGGGHWKHTIDSWWRMSHAEREHAARNEILTVCRNTDPSMLSRPKTKKQKTEVIPMERLNMADIGRSDWEDVPDDIKAQFAAIRTGTATTAATGPTKTPRPAPPVEVCTGNIPGAEPLCLSPAELEILRAAELRAKSRVF